ncbi:MULTISPECIES: VTT domain-containing protein [unclassified Gemella]|uniref:VTT domain-containing protein n=1 Tax=unclassified Gemella TaxID=2624949 RepID=UPI0010746056|nr:MULTISPECIES: VTT domain-containing protein [unclassified Gemella]MBF0709817.1 VTT domain-containing protein [Gemella sp. GL1.1]MBF0747094.1 VTT domain-containing protein [Gemella sp. 19428wG2_WT2a]NYS27161.1 VTT domain-containing protein [Gemella sp. GL1]TFU58337.1 cytochrome O ubiquinol oxidase [Gemella sp. WT2a]
MDTLKFLIDFILHIDDHLGELMTTYGPWWMYAIIFLIIFIETGVVIMPFLPGDSLLFASGALWAATGNNIFLLVALCIIAGFLGDGCNYFIGKYFSDYLKSKEWFKKIVKDENIEEAEKFIAKHGGKSVFLARFFPIIRTIVPFTVGAGNMEYKRFIVFNLAGAITWCLTFLVAGYLFGNIPFVKDNFSLVVLGIIVVSLIPLIIGFAKSKLKK